MVYAFGGLDFSGMIDHGRPVPDVPFLDQVKLMKERDSMASSFLMASPIAASGPISHWIALYMGRCTNGSRTPVFRLSGTLAIHRNLG